MILFVSNVFFIGLMGAGETTVGRAVARRLGPPFFDFDHEIETRCGVHVPAIFGHEGEVGFRGRETYMIDELTVRGDVVIATGGGAVLRTENRALLREYGTVIYLHANPRDLCLRTRRDRNRPLLQTKNPRAKLGELHAVHGPLYRDVAHFVIETGKPIVAQLVNMVLIQLEVAGVVAPPAGSPTPSQVSPRS